MDASAVIAFPRSLDGAITELGSDDDAGSRAILEIDAAIALVASRIARRVRLIALPFVADVAATGLAHARAAGMAFAFERADRVGVVTVTVGPLE
jgi:hypothetical protein